MSAPAINRRGACPSLADPMQTGDGLLARLKPVSQGLSASQLIGLCKSAAANGNGVMEITARGNLQVRGLDAASAIAFSDDVTALKIEVRSGLPIDISPLAGLDPGEISDPRPLAKSIAAGVDEAGLSTRLGPKLSVVIDGGGAISLAAISADIRITAGQRRTGSLWRLALGGDASSAEPLGATTTRGAVVFVIDLLSRIAEHGITGRGRDLIEQPSPTRTVTHAPPILAPLALTDGRAAVALAMPFGSCRAADLAAFVNSIAETDLEFRLAPGRQLLVLCAPAAMASVLRAAHETGFIINANDSRLRISACAGAPACASGHIATRALAHRIALESPHFAHLHISGCAKGCAHPAAAPLTLVGRDDGIGIVVNGKASGAAEAVVQPADLPEALEVLNRAAP